MASGDEGFGSRMQVIRRFTEECWNGANLAAIAGLVAEDCRFHDPVFPHLAPGPASLQHHIERVRRAFPDLKFTILEAIDRGKDVEVQWSSSATQAAEFLEIPATKKFATITGTSTYRIEGGKIVENWVKWDVMSLMKQLESGGAGEETKHLPKTG